MNPSDHQAAILDQFTRQARPFAQAPELHNDAILALMVDAAQPAGCEHVLDIACGPGSVVVAFAPHVRRATGLDATPAMLEQARALAAAQQATNVEWVIGDVEALPYPEASFEIVTCRFAFHHFREPARAFAEMLRVCRPRGRVLVCDGIVHGDPAKAAEFNGMELLRDPSTVAFRSVDYLASLYRGAGLAEPQTSFFRVPVERDDLIAKSFPANDDREGLRRLITASVEGDRMGLDSRREGDTVWFAYRCVVLCGCKSA